MFKKNKQDMVTQTPMNKDIISSVTSKYNHSSVSPSAQDPPSINSIRNFTQNYHPGPSSVTAKHQWIPEEPHEVLLPDKYVTFNTIDCRKTFHCSPPEKIPLK